MADSSSSQETSLSMNTILHLITIRLSSSNYLFWINQMIPLFSYQKLLGHVDGSLEAPPASILVDGKPMVNPELTSWTAADQRAVILLQASLTEEAFFEVVGLTSTRAMWIALESAYGNSSLERVQNLQNQLRLLSKGTSTVADFGRKFKSLCDQLAAISQLVADSDKTHWFLCGIGASFETFSTSIRASSTVYVFRDLLAKVEGHEIFLKSIHGEPSPPVAFSAAVSSVSSVGRGRGAVVVGVALFVVGEVMVAGVVVVGLPTANCAIKLGIMRTNVVGSNKSYS